MILVTATSAPLLAACGPTLPATGVAGVAFAPMEASRVEERGGYLDFARLTPGELGGMLSSLVLLASLWLPWFTTSGNPNSKINSAKIGANDSATAWQVFHVLD